MILPHGQCLCPSPCRMRTMFISFQCATTAQPAEWRAYATASPPNVTSAPASPPSHDSRSRRPDIVPTAARCTSQEPSSDHGDPSFASPSVLRPRGPCDGNTYMLMRGYTSPATHAHQPLKDTTTAFSPAPATETGGTWRALHRHFSLARCTWW
jgi:hypothetical protein